MTTDLDVLWDRVLRVDEKVDQVLALLKEMEQQHVYLAEALKRGRKKRRPIGFEVIGGGVIPQDTGGPSGGED